MEPDGPELIASQVVSDQPLVANLREFIQLVYGESYKRDEGTGLPRDIRLGIEKFRLGHGRKYYRLIWIGKGQAVLAAERPQEYQRKLDAILAGHELAGETGAKFDDKTR
jgi:hypothetical protein